MELTDLSNIHSLAVIGALVAFAYLCAREPRWGIYLITAILPAYVIRPTLFGFPTTVLELAVLVLFIVWILKDKRYTRINWRFWKSYTAENPLPNAFRGPLALILISAFISMAMSAHQPAAFGIFKAYFIEPMLFLIVLLYEVKNQKHVEHMIQLLGMTTLVIGGLAIWQYMTGFGIAHPYWAAAASRRVTTVFGYPNANGLFVAPVAALYLGYLMKRDTLTLTLFKILVVACAFITVIAARSMGAAVALGTVGLIALLRYKKIRSVMIGIVGIALTLFISYTGALNSAGQMWSRIQNNYLDLTSTSLEIRINQWRETGALIADHPIAGAGLAGYQQALVPYHRYDFLEIFLYPHNIVLNFWAELGLLGVIAFVWLGWAIVRRLRACYRTEAPTAHDAAFVRGVTYAWIVILIHGMVDVPYFKNDLSMLWMLLVGLTVVVTRFGVISSNHAARPKAF